jgi:hypothetical protein
MTFDATTKTLLSIIALALTAIALHPYITPPIAQAQSDQVHDVYVEPGVAVLRAPDGSKQVLGKVVVDLHNGKVWGFPTLTQDPYPSTGTQTTPQTSHPFLLGKFALADMDK